MRLSRYYWIKKLNIIIRNYQNIINKPNYIKPEIAQCIILETGHSIAIIKTLWIKFIQRKWKKIFSERRRIIEQRSCIHNILYKEVRGIWPHGLNILPGICGMLSQMQRGC